MFDRDGLTQVASFLIVYQYLVAVCYHRIPALSLGEGRSHAAIWQGDHIRQIRTERVRELGDKQHHDHYETQNHRNGQNGDQYTQIFHQGRIDRLRLRAVIHGFHTASRPDRRRSTCAP